MRKWLLPSRLPNSVQTTNQAQQDVPHAARKARFQENFVEIVW